MFKYYRQVPNRRLIIAQKSVAAARVIRIKSLGDCASRSRQWHARQRNSFHFQRLDCLPSWR